MKIVFLALHYTKADTAPGMYTDLMTTFQQNGHEVLVVAPVWKVKDKMSLHIESGVNVLRVTSSGLFGSGLIQKGISNILLPYHFKKAIKHYKVKLDFDLIIIPTPPITMISVALWIKKQSNGKLYLILRDIFPQNGVDLNIMKKKGLPYRYFRKLEKKLYHKSDQIGCMSPENINYIKRHNKHLHFEKLHLLPNWEELKESNENKEEIQKIREDYGLIDKTVALYAGNVGIPQQLENIIELAQAVDYIDDLVFLIIGWGTQMNKMRELAKQKKLKNILFLESVSRIDLGNILALSDIGLISLNKKFTIPNYPSKVNSYYKYKLPVLCSVDENTDFGKIQEKIGCGFWSVSGDTEALKKNLLKLYEDAQLRSEMGLKGYRYMQNYLTPQHACDTILDKIT